jgi:hypothetical protein
MNVRSWFRTGDSQKEQGGFAPYDKLGVVHPIKLKVMMRGEVKDGKPNRNPIEGYWKIPWNKEQAIQRV